MNVTGASRPATRRPNTSAAILALAASLALAGCVSFGGEAPERLLTLTPDASAPAGSAARAGGEASKGAIAVMIPETSAKLDVTLSVDAGQGANWALAH